MALQSPSDDRRVRKTRERLRGALFSLIHEKSYDAIAVKEILHRADVGRSTFYAHFDDKDELLASGIRGILRSASASGPGGVVAWSLPLFEHIQRHQGAAHHGAAGDQSAVHERLRAILREHVAENLGGRPCQRQPAGAEVVPPVALVAEHVAATFVLVLEWAMESGGRVSPEAADELFRTLVAPAL